MRTTPIALTAVLSASLLAACSAGGSTTGATGVASASGSGGDVIKVAGTGVSFPSSYMEDGELVGYETDVITEAAKRAGYTVEFSTMDFSGLLGAISAGRVDTSGTNVTWTEERAKTFVFSAAYAFDGVGIGARADDDSIQTLEDLQGKTVTAGAGTTNEAAVEAWIEETGYDVTLRSFETADAATQEVLVGRADAVARPQGSAVAQIERQGLELKTVGDLLTYEQTRFPFADTERGRQLAQDISESLNEMREDGTLSDLAVQYFTYDRTQPQDGEGHRTPEPTEITTPEDQG